MNLSPVERFQRLFRGREDAHGRYVPASGGNKKRVSTQKKPVPDGAWERHLEGDGPFLGIVPIRRDNTCYFGAIDLDDNAADHAAIETSISSLKLPLVVCRSKSGGAHLYLFLVDPAPAAVLITKLKSFVKVLNISNPPDKKGRVPSIEVFPKQSKTSDSNIGNWINLPYYGGLHKTDRYAFRKGAPLSLEDFLDYAESLRITSDELKVLNPDAGDDNFFRDGPPCLQALHREGFAEGERNQGLYNVGIFLKLRYPDDWDERLHAYNEERVDPPLPEDEVRQIIRSLDGKTYVYKCSDIPIVDFCKKNLCKKQLFGIEAFRQQRIAEAMPKMSALTKINTDPPRWSIMVEGVEIPLSTDDLMNLARFRKSVFERTNRIIPFVKAHEWDDVLRLLMEDVQIIEAPEDAGIFGQFRIHVLDFLKLRFKSESREALLLGKPWAENGRVYFRSHDLGAFLKRRQFNDYYLAGQVYDSLRSLGAGHVQINVKGQIVQAWWLPTPENELTEDLDLPRSDDPDF
jgi:hypothetical protein